MSGQLAELAVPKSVVFLIVSIATYETAVFIVVLGIKYCTCFLALKDILQLEADSFSLDQLLIVGINVLILVDHEADH